MIKIEIPTNLKNFRFIKLRPTADPKLGKRPLEDNWTTDKNYSYDEMTAFNVNKYGVLCGYNNLVVVDCDIVSFQEKALQDDLFKNTFMVKTAGKGLYHFYFIVDDNQPLTKRLDQFTEDGKIRIADIQGVGTQVLGPNSEIGNKTYDVVNDCLVKEVSYIELLSKIKTFIPNTQYGEEYKKKRKEAIEDDFDVEIDPVISYIKSKITIRDLLEEIGVETIKGRNCECPWHTSENGQCFSYDNHQFHCFHCGRHGSMFDFVMEYSKCDFIEAKRILSEKVGVPEKVIKHAIALAKKAKKAQCTEFAVKQFMNDNYVYTIRNDNNSEMWIYSNGIYTPYGKSFIKSFCRAIFNSYYTVALANQVISKIEADSYINEDIFFDNFYENEIPVKNGILNVKKQEIIPFDPKKIFFNKINAFYNPKQEECSNCMDFFESIFTESDEIKTIQEMFGYVLYNRNKFKKAFMFIGGGDNGKSVLLDLLSFFVSEENVSNVTLSNFDEDQFAASGLFGKMANVNADVKKGKLEETAMIKNLISGDTIYANRKFLTPIKFKNRAKMLFAANNLPMSDDTTDGFFTRWVIIELNYKFKSKIDYDELTEEELKSGRYKVADPDILNKLISEKELSGLLNWALKGLQRLLKNKKFTKSSTTEKMRLFWERKSSSMKAFIMDKIEFTYDADDYITTVDLREIYTIYCKDNKIDPQSVRECTPILQQYATQYTTKRCAMGGGFFESKKVWSKIKIKK